jgi:hypothetical protein
MRSALFIILFTFLTLTTHAINLELKNRLDSIMFKDQAVRELQDRNITTERRQQLFIKLGLSEKEENNLSSIMVEQDKVNLTVIREIITKYGYPGKTLVGEPTNKAAWYVIQHSDAIEEFFPLIEKAGKGNELPMTLVAMMEDRLLMQKGLEQIYGTQLYGKKIKDKETGEEEWFRFIWPVKDPDKVNELRKSIGFKETVEELALRNGVDYKVYSIAEINEIFTNETNQ